MTIDFQAMSINLQAEIERLKAEITKLKAANTELRELAEKWQKKYDEVAGNAWINRFREIDSGVACAPPISLWQRTEDQCLEEFHKRFAGSAAPADPFYARMEGWRGCWKWLRGEPERPEPKD